jgi:hypothetical protein
MKIGDGKEFNKIMHDCAETVFQNNMNLPS